MTPTKAQTLGKPFNVVFKPGANTLTTTNDIEGLNLGSLVVIGTNGTFNLAGKKLSFNLSGVSAVSAVHSNLTLNISAPLEFKADGFFQSRGNATFDGDLTFADGIDFKFNPSYLSIPSWPSTEKDPAYTNTFNGAFNAPNAKIEIAYGNNESRHHRFEFNTPVNVKEFTFGFALLNNNIFFNASGNTIGQMNVTGHMVYFRGTNPLSSGMVLNWFNCAGYHRRGYVYFSKNGGNTVELDRIVGVSDFIASESSATAMYYGQNMQTESSGIMTTLLLKGTADATSYGWFNKGLSLVWDPAGNYTQEFRDRIHDMNGTITVKGGTFKSGGTNSFPKVTKIIICDGARFEAESTMPFTSGSVDLEIHGSGRLALPAGTQCSFKSVTVDDIPVAGTNYVGAGSSVAGAVTADWLEGSAVIIAPKVNATFWMEAADGDWGTAANWSDGVPSVSKQGYVSAKGGDYTVTVKATDAAAGKLTIINNGTGTATVKVEGTVAWPNVDCAVMRGGRLEVPTGATLDCNDSSAKFTVDKGEFLVSGGTATFDGATVNNFTGAFTVTGDETHTGRVSVTAGILRYGPQDEKNYKLTVEEFGHLDVSGNGALHACDDNVGASAIKINGGTFTVRDDGVYSSGDDARKFCGMFGTGHTVFSGNSRLCLNNAGGSKARFYVMPGGAGETSVVELRDQAQFDIKNAGDSDGIYIGNTANATGILVIASSARQPTGEKAYLSYRFQIGSFTKATGIARIESGYVYAASYRGIIAGGSTRGKWGNVQVDSHGELYVSGGCCRLDGSASDSTEAYMQGMVIGDASNIIDDSNPAGKYADNARLAEGYLELSGDGIITNTYGITTIGGGRATGLFRQTGGTYEQCSTSTKSPFVVGNAGGFGTYLLSGGEANLKGDMFIGGTFTNHIASGCYMAQYGYPVDCHTATGVVQVSGGKLAVAKDLNLGFDGRGVLEINGKGGEVTVGGDLVLSNTVVSADVSTSSALKFTLDEDGVLPIKVKGSVVNTYGTVIEVDVTKFAGTHGKCKLITFDSFDGAEPEVRFIGSNAERMVSVRSEHALRVGLPRGFSIFVQ